MIHLTDIQQRLSANQEPKEITEMRENVISAFSNLEFIEEGHIYNIHNPDGSVIEKIPSASAIIHRFEPEADWDDIANNYALKRDLNVDDVKRKWKENNLRATNSGSVHHLYGEMLQNFIRTGDKNVICEAMKLQYEQGYLIPSSGKQDAIMKYWEELFVIDDIYPFMAECKMYMPPALKSIPAPKSAAVFLLITVWVSSSAKLQKSATMLRCIMMSRWAEQRFLIKTENQQK